MKYIDADLLQKDIDELKKETADCVGKYADGFRFALEHFTFLIGHYSRQEQPEVDLEKDAIQFCFDKGLNVTPYQAKTIASHFYELGKNSK